MQTLFWCEESCVTDVSEILYPFSRRSTLNFDKVNGFILRMEKKRLIEMPVIQLVPRPIHSSKTGFTLALNHHGKIKSGC